MNSLDLASWASAALTLLGLTLLRRHWTRLPLLAPDPVLPPGPPSVCLCIPVRDEALEQATVWKAAWAELARKQIGPIA